MTQNGHLNEHQSNLFQIYRVNGFGDPKYSTHGRNMESVFKILKKHPNLSKIPVREQIIRFEQQFSERNENLNELLSQFKKIGSNLIQNLFQIEDRMNFWNHTLAFRQPPSAVGLTKTQKRELKQHHHQEFLSYLNDFIDKETRDFISNPSNHYRLRVITLYKTLELAREKLKQSGKNIRPISKAMVNLIAGAGFLNQDYLDMLNNSKGIKAGVQMILKERENIAIELGFEGFLEFKKFFEVSDSFQDILLKINPPVHLPYNHKENQLLTNQTQTLRLRALSLQESPFRSCLSGDCTTWMYFELGLHPSFLFFTLTDEYNRSSGQITVVLGDAKDHEGNKVKTAFVDNIHNVPLEKIIPMLEGIRLSLSEYGYRLALSKFNSEYKKLSNEKVIIHYVNNEVLPYLTSRLTKFSTHNFDSNVFKGKLYREYSSIKMMEFEGSPTQNDNPFTITPGLKYLPNSIHEDLSVDFFNQDFLNLEASKTEEHQMRFLDNLPIFIYTSPTYPAIIENRLLNNIYDNETTFSVKKRSLYNLFRFFYDNINTLLINRLLHYFTPKERKEILGERKEWKNLFIEKSRSSDLPLSFVEFFIENFGMDIFRSYSIMKKFFSYNRINTLKMLIEKGLDVNAKLNNGSTLLHIVANTYYFSLKEEDNMVWLLIENGANINARDDEGSTPLHVAAINSSFYAQEKIVRIVRILIENGADINTTNNDGLTPLQLAKKYKITGKRIELLNKAHSQDKKRGTLKKFIQKLIATVIILS